MELYAQGLVRALCFFHAFDYAPTETELILAWDAGPEYERTAEPYSVQKAWAALQLLKERGLVRKSEEAVFLPDHRVDHEERAKRGRYFLRKIHRAKRAARWFARLEGVRFVAVCNTTSFAFARDDADVDFFIVTHEGALWQTRGWAVLPFRLFGQRPRMDREVKDAICLSFFVDDAALHLRSLQVEDDVYFRHWFLSLVPIFDTGIASQLWSANRDITSRHPFASPWQAHPELCVRSPSILIPSVRSFEAHARRVQERRFPNEIRSLMNRSTHVVVNDHVLKFHTDDRREHFRERYRSSCHAYGIEG